jgi:hypothetical protein
MMNYKILLLTILILSAILTTNVSAHIALNYPNGGENFQVGEVVNIQWQVLISHGSANLDLYFSSDGGITWEPIALNLVDSQRAYDWTVPNIETDSGRVKVIQDNDVGTDYEGSSGIFIISTPTGIYEAGVNIFTYKLFDAYPNPFNPTTTIRYSIPSDGIVELIVYNSIGEEVSELVNEFKSAGNYEIDFSAGDLTSGIYFYRIQTASFVETKKMILLK